MNSWYFIYIDHIVKYIYIYIYICGTWGPSIMIVDPSCFSGLLSPISIYICKKKSKVWFLFMFGRSSKVPKCQRIKISSQWRHMYNKENNQLFIYGPRCEKMKQKLYLGGPGNAWGRTSIIRLGLSPYASIISFMLLYMSNMEAIW